MTTRLSRLAQSLAGTVLTVLLLVVPPWLLTTQVGPPIPTSWPDLDTFRSIATTGVTDTFIITTLAVIIWATWAQLALAVTTELIAAIRRRPAIRLPLLPGTQPLAARLVAATLLLVTLVQPRPAAATVPLDLPAATVTVASIIDTPTADTPQRDTTPHSAPTAPTRTITVSERDSWWSLAETHLTDGIRWRELRDLNVGRTQPDGTTITTATDQLQPGWTLHVPATNNTGTATPAETATPVDLPRPADAAAPAVTTDPADHTPGGEQADDTSSTSQGQWDVEPGDHFWHIATTTLEQAWDRTPDDHEIIPYWQQLIDTNHHRLTPPGNPDLIHPGQQFQLPTPPADPARAVGDGGGDTAPPVEDSEEQLHDPAGRDADAAEPDATSPNGQRQDGAPPLEPEAERVRPDGSPADAQNAPQVEVEVLADEQTTSGQADEGGVHLPDPAGSGPTSAVPPSSGWERSVTTTPEPSANSAQPGTAADELTFNLWSRLAAGVAAAGLAGAGLTVLIARRRRYALQQRPPGTRLPTPAPATLDHLHRLELAAPDEHTTLGALSDLLMTIPATARPALVTLTDDGTVQLLYDDDTDPGQPPEPWRDTAAGDGQPAGWVARLGDGGLRRSIGLPLLLTLGRLNDQTILANLGSLPSLAVCGPHDQVTDVLHAATLEIATSRIAGPLSVVVAGAATHPALSQATMTDDPAGPLELARRERAQQIIEEDRTVVLIVAHADTALPDLSEASGDPLVGVLHAAGTPPNDAWTVTINGDTTTLHLPDGGLVNLERPELDLDALHHELDRHDHVEADATLITDDDADGGTRRTKEPDNGAVAAKKASTRSPVIDLTGAAEASDPTAVAALNGQAPDDLQATGPVLEVRILGPVEVRRDGQPLVGLAPLTLQILVYLATHRDGVTPERLDDVIWNGQLASPNSQRLRSALTKLRNTLGPGPDGDPYLPRRHHRTDPVRLVGPVATDLDQAVGQLEHARAVTGVERLAYLDRALEHVRGEPFAGWPLSWASEIAERAIAQLQDAAAAAAAGHRRREEYRQAEHAIRTGLKLCDPNETLYIEWARLEAARGRHDQIPRIQQRLKAAYDTHADDEIGFVGTITPSTAAAFHGLSQHVAP